MAVCLLYFVDLQKDFDSVDYDTLPKKLNIMVYVAHQSHGSNLT